MKKLLITTSILSLIVSIYFGLGQFVRSNTHYIDDFDISLIDNIRDGAIISEVWNGVGQPLNISTNSPNQIPKTLFPPWSLHEIESLSIPGSVITFSYSKPKNVRLEYYEQIWIQFSSGKMSAKHIGWYYE